MTKTILVIEDNPDNMALMDEMLDDAGFEVLKAGTAEDGIRLLKATNADLVLMDISLPKMSGLDATRVIRSDPVIDTVPVVAVTAHASAADEETALSAGCDDFITKPINESFLLEVIGRYL